MEVRKKLTTGADNTSSLKISIFIQINEVGIAFMFGIPVFISDKYRTAARSKSNKASRLYLHWQSITVKVCMCLVVLIRVENSFPNSSHIPMLYHKTCWQAAKCFAHFKILYTKAVDYGR